MVGIGYRKSFDNEKMLHSNFNAGFIEVAPENWMGVGGYWKKTFEQVLEKYPLYTHGLSLSLGSPDNLNYDFLKDIKSFLDTYNAQIYSEHLSFSSFDNAHLYDLLPIPFTEDAVKHVAHKIKQTQDFLERKIAVEIVSYYSPIAPEMKEIEFIKAVVEEADCLLLMDVNNIYVNAFNHNYDSKAFIDQLPFERVAYIHMAGHEKINENLIIDTHGSPIIDPVYELFEYAMKKVSKETPVLLERDFNIPELEALQIEIDRLREIKNNAKTKLENAVA